MMLDTLRIVTDWLNDNTHGVAAKLALLDYDAAETVPVGTLTIADETRNAMAAVGKYPADWSIIVALQPVDQMVGDSAMYTHDADIPILIRAQRVDSDAAAAIRDLLYTTRAIVHSIEALFNETIAAAVTARTRNQVHAMFYTQLGQALTRDQLEDNRVTAAIAVTVRARDLLTA